MTWRLLYVRPLAEKPVVQALKDARLPISAYYPVERVWRGIGARRRPTDRPLLPRMVFVNFPDDDGLMNAVMNIDGVTKVISPARRDDTKLIEEFIGGLMESQANHEFDKTYRKAKAPLKVGDRVEITKGQFKGMGGMVAKLSTARRVQLTTSLFGRQGKMDIDPEHVDLIEEEPEAPPPRVGLRQKIAA